MQIHKTGEEIRKKLLYCLSANIVLPAIGRICIFPAEFCDLLFFAEMSIDNAEVVDCGVLPNTYISDKFDRALNTAGARQTVTEKRSLRHRTEYKRIIIEIYKMLAEAWYSVKICLDNM